MKIWYSKIDELLESIIENADDINRWYDELYGKIN